MFWYNFWPRVFRQHARSITGEYIKVLSDPNRREVSGICNNLLKYSYHYIDLILLSYLPEVTIYILCLNNYLTLFLQGYDGTRYLKSYPPNVNHITIQ